MILSKDVTAKGVVTKKGTRTLANEKFAQFITDTAVRTQLFNATVLIKTADGRGTGTGVILNTADVAGTATAYVLTAKHLLGSLSGGNMRTKKPSELATTALRDGLRLFYGPTALEGAPPSAAPAAVSAFNFKGSDDTTWGYDIMVLESTTPAFCTFVENNRFILASQAVEYEQLLANKPAKGCPILDSAVYTFLQMGYGAGRDADVAETASYDNKEGLIQCRWPTLGARAPLPSAFEIDTIKGKGKAKDTYKLGPESFNLIAVNANNTTSTGPGDSGGPLFALKTSDLRKLYLVGVTTGANYFSDPAYRSNPASAPRDTTLSNNVSTFWDTFYKDWDWGA